jgi:hypothetical protein
MIRAELKNYLILSAGEDTAAVVDRAVELFEQYDPECEFMNSYDSAVGDNVDNFDEAVCDQVIHLTETLLDSVLNQHSIFTTDIATTTDKTDIARALLMLQSWENKAQIEIELDVDGSNEEKLCGLFAMVNGDSVERYLPLIDKFDKNLLEKIREELLQTLEEEVIDISEIERNLTDYKKVKAVYSEPSKFDDLLKTPGAIGQPFLIYLNNWALINAKYLTDLDSGNIAKIFSREILLMACLSKEGLSQVQKSLRDNMNLITTDLADSTKIYTAVTQAFLEVNRAQV